MTAIAAGPGTAKTRAARLSAKQARAARETAHRPQEVSMIYDKVGDKHIAIAPKVRAMPAAHSGVLRTEPVPVSALRAPAVIARGHRAYLDNPRLFTTRVHRAPVPRGHRAFLSIAGRR